MSPQSAAPLLSPIDVLVVVGLVAFYLTPSVVAVTRGCVAAGRVIRVNVLYGWTGVGWLAALVAAVRNPSVR